MPVRHERSETRGRPPLRRRAEIGKNGSTRSHNASGSSAAAIPVHATSAAEDQIWEGFVTRSKHEILRVEASFLGSKRGLLVEFLDFGVELVEDAAKGARQRIGVWEQRGPVRPEDPKIELGVEEGDFEAVAGSGVPVR